MKYIWTYENNSTKGGGNGDILEQNAYVLWEFSYYSEIDCGKLRYM